MTGVAAGTIAGCTACGGVCSIDASRIEGRVRLRCPHCGHPLPDVGSLRISRSRTAAFATSALLLYPPAVLMPVLRIDRLGHAHETGIIDGVATLFTDGHGWLATIVLVCSVIIPLSKLLGLLVLCTARIRVGTATRSRVWGVIEALGRWGMLDVLLVAASNVDGLQVVLHASDRAGMREGGAVTYRGVQIGRILDVGLAPRASRVEATVLIDGRYAPIVRTNSRFFSTSGIGFELGFDGLRADVESLESMVAGGVGVATPNRLGDPAEPGARYPLRDRADPGWLEWDPEIDLDVDGVD